MNDSNIDDDFDEIDTPQVDEHEYEISVTSNRPINWHRVELMKEIMALKKQLSDYDDFIK